MIYAAKLDPEDEGGFTVTFRDIHGVTYGETQERALEQAVDCLITALSMFADEGKDLPPATAPKRGEHLVFVPALYQAKLELIKRMAETKTSNTKLAEMLGCSEAAVRRMVNLNHESKISRIEAALGALGKRLSVRVE
ncbi:MAG: type II toxin-antitoxin system HicB family antitoxin [Alphaproteobacteria bacterium]